MGFVHGTYEEMAFGAKGKTKKRLHGPRLWKMQVKSDEVENPSFDQFMSFITSC